MSTLYFIKDATGNLQISIPPGTINGAGAPTFDTSLTLYGEGHIKWGEGVNQNIYRILSNFACHSKVNGDFNPSTGVFDYSVETSPLIPKPILPKDYHDLGVGNGVNKPIIGQMWFNSTDDHCYVWSGTKWKRVNNVHYGLVMPAYPTLGDLWFDNNGRPTTADPWQLKIWNGSVWISVADQYLRLDGTRAMEGNLNMAMHRIINLGDPINGNDAVNLSFADGRYVNVTGDTMTGDLNMDNADILIDGGRLIVNGNNAGFTSRIFIDNGDGFNKPIRFLTNGEIRWIMGATAEIESGGNTGTDFRITRFADGVDGYLDDLASYEYGTPFKISRQTGDTQINGTTLETVTVSPGQRNIRIAVPFDVNNQIVKNVPNGTANDHAVNFGQLNAVIGDVGNLNNNLNNTNANLNNVNNNIAPTIENYINILRAYTSYHEVGYGAAVRLSNANFPGIASDFVSIAGLELNFYPDHAYRSRVMCGAALSFRARHNEATSIYFRLRIRDMVSTAFSPVLDITCTDSFDAASHSMDFSISTGLRSLIGQFDVTPGAGQHYVLFVEAYVPGKTNADYWLNDTQPAGGSCWSKSWIKYY